MQERRDNLGREPPRELVADEAAPAELLDRDARSLQHRLEAELEVRHLARLPVRREPLEADQPSGLPGGHAPDLERALEDASRRSPFEAQTLAEERRLQLVDERLERPRRLERDLDEGAGDQPATASSTRSGMSKFA